VSWSKPVVWPWVVAGLLTAASPALAQQEEEAGSDGLEISLRAGYGIPLGTLADNTKLSDLMTATIPFVFEIGKRFNHDYTVALFFQYGVGLVKDGDTSGCGNGMPSCSSTDYRFGIEGLYRIKVPGSFTPWIGFGVGYEILTIGQTVNGLDSSVSLRGFEFGALEAGGDFRLTPTVALGPYVSCSFGQYGTVSTSGGDQDVTNTGIHSWLQLGARATFSFFGP
jgi:hypothetical protein